MISLLNHKAMYNRVLDFNIIEEDSIFLFGARQTGKSTLLQSRFADAVYIDLLKSDVYERYRRNPELIRTDVGLEPKDKIIIIDEVQKVPNLLDEVHWLMVNEKRRFVLSGSSARKLKRGGANLLGGRAVGMRLYPLVSKEIPDFDVIKACNYGLLPRHYEVKNPVRRLKSYVGDYLREEISAEALVRNLSVFNRFLEIAAFCSGEILNYNNIASDCGVSAPTIKEYFSILEETYIGYLISPFTKTKKRTSIQSKKFYLFDVGIANYLQKRTFMLPGSNDFGKAFEQLVFQEVIAYLSYTENINELSYWRTTRGYEVDMILGEGKVAIEIKSCREVVSRYTKGLKAFKEEFPEARLIIVSLEKQPRLVNDVEVYPVMTFFDKLWKNEII